MGIKGSGMAGVAKLASKMGYSVSGCDLEDKGHSVSHLKDIDLLVISPAVLYQNKKHPEYKEALDKNMVLTWQEFLGKVLLKNKKVIAIAGTHGKSTTTAMAGKMLEDAGFDPIVVVGAKVPLWSGGVRFGKGNWAVVEADEFNDNFLNYFPEIIIINNIEFDHPDYFKDVKQLKNSFIKFTKNLKGKKLLITGSDPVINSLDFAKITGSDPAVASDPAVDRKFKLKIWGKHNQKNANMVYILGRKLGISDKNIVKSLESFEGIGRRMELLGKSNCGSLIYDDYAHHPTAIKVTLNGLRQKYPDKKILALIEPHGYKRTKALLLRYKGVFKSVDKVVIGPIFKARDKFDGSVTPEKVAVESGHKDAVGIDSEKELIKNLKLEIGNYNIIIVMGAGRSSQWAKRLLKI